MAFRAQASSSGTECVVRTLFTRPSLPTFAEIVTVLPCHPAAVAGIIGRTLVRGSGAVPKDALGTSRESRFWAGAAAVSADTTMQVNRIVVTAIGCRSLDAGASWRLRGDPGLAERSQTTSWFEGPVEALGTQ